MFLMVSLMTLSLIDERTKTHGKGNRECIAQGVGNILSGCFQSMGGCAMIGQSMINIRAGGRGRLSGIAAAICLLGLVLFGGPCPLSCRRRLTVTRRWGPFLCALASSPLFQSSSPLVRHCSLPCFWELVFSQGVILNSVMMT